MKKRTWVTLLCCVSLMLPVSNQGKISSGAEPDRSGNEYIIQADNDRAFDRISQQYEEDILMEESGEASLENENMLLMNLTEEQACRLEKRKDVSVECNISLHGEGVGKSEREDVKRMAEEQWNLSAIQAESVKKVSENHKSKIKVAILDSGVDYLSDIPFDNQVSLIPDENTDDKTGHGSIIANLIARNKNGFCETGMIPENSPIGLYNVRILDENNETTLSRVIQGLQWCIENDMDVINMSFGTEIYSEILHDAIIKAKNAGILMVASVGNSGEGGEDILEYPAAYEEVIGVGSVNEKMEHSTFSNTGSAVELVAPGENIPITSYWGLQGAGSGTSYAAAHVTGVSALLWAENRERDAEEIRALLDHSAVNLGESARYGYGMVNYQYASQHKDLADKKETLAGKYQGNQEKPETYEVPVTLRASWGKKNHSQLIPSSVSGLTEHEVKVVKNASEYADTSSNLQEYDVLHARGNTNYVSTAKCLYEAALAWKGGSDYSKIYSKANAYYSSDEDSDTRTTNINKLKTAMRKAVYYNFQDTSQSGSSVTANRGRLQLLGLAIHVAGDTYAHKAMCDGSDVGTRQIQEIYDNDKDGNLKRALKNGQKTIDALKSAAKKGLTTAAMGNKIYFVKEKTCNTYYTDSVKYMAKRYSVATKVGTNKLLNYYSNGGTFKPFVFCPYEISTTSGYRKSYQYKTRHLMKYLQDGGFNILSYLKGKNNYSPNDWQMLSYDK